MSWNHAKREPYEDRQNDKIIKMAKYRDEVRNEINWRDGVGDCDAEEPPRYLRGVGVTEDKSSELNVIPESGDQ